MSPMHVTLKAGVRREAKLETPARNKAHGRWKLNNFAPEYIFFMGGGGGKLVSMKRPKMSVSTIL